MSYCTAGKIAAVFERCARYMAGDPALAPLVAWDWRQPPWETILEIRKSFPIDRSTLVEALRRQNAPFLPDDAALQENIEALQAPHTFTITTGQQPGWLTGPLYTVVKAAHTLLLAQQLNRAFAGRYRFVPVFWIAAEDHDAEEVRSVALSWTETLRYEGRFCGAVGRHRIEPAFPQRAYDLALQQYWTVGKPWEMAFRESMQALFQGTGLVWLSPDDPALKTLVAPLWVREIKERLTGHAHALATQYLASIGERPLLHPRPVNLFWLSDTERRYPTPSEEEALLQAAYQTPERLSPNVLLRPLMQEFILPNIAYVAGPGEVAYWLELLPVFEAFGVPMPVVYPRKRVRVITEPVPPLPEGLSVEQLWSLSQARLRTLLAESWGAALVKEAIAWWQRHRPPIEELLQKPGFASSGRQLLRLWQQAGQSIRRAALRQALHKYAPQIDAILRFRSRIEPEGRSQERTLNIHAFAPQAPAQWVQDFIHHMANTPSEMVHIMPTAHS